MRKLLLSLLMPLMLMPSLACAMPSCHEKANQEVSPPCHDDFKTLSSNDHVPSDSHKKNFNLLLDCMGVDLQSVDEISLTVSDFDLQPVVYENVYNSLHERLAYSGGLSIRGPPVIKDSGAQHRPPLILTTQRFRI